MSLSIKERFNLLLKKTEDQPATFDDSSFSLKVQGGPSQADLIKLEAELINPEKFGNKNIQLNCKWFNKTQKDLIQIQGTLGQSHYQPSLKDVGTIIRVECFPSIQGKTYEGMPIHRDIGPLIIQKQTEEDAQEFVESGSATFLVRVVRSSKSTHYSQVDGLIKVTADQISVKTKQGDQFVGLFAAKMDEHFPQYQSDSRNHKLLKIIFNETQFAQILVQQSRMRDILVLASKMLVGNKIINEVAAQQKQQQQQQQINNPAQIPSEKNVQKPVQRAPQPDDSPLKKKAKALDLMHVAQLTKQCKQLSNQNQNLRKQVQEHKHRQAQSSEKVKTLEERLQSLSKNYFSIQTQLKQIKNKNSTDDDKFLYVNNQIRVLKQQNQTLKKQLTQTNGILLSTQSSLKSYKSQSDKPTYQQLEDLYRRFKNESEVLGKRLNYEQSERLKFEEQILFEKQKNQQISYNLDKVNSRYESLLKQSKLAISPKQPNNSNNAREEQIIRLKLQIKQLVQENDQLRKKSPIKSNDKLEVKSPKKAQLKQLQKLANRLSQAVTDKDQIIQDMREVNKQLMIKVKSMEQKVEK